MENFRLLLNEKGTMNRSFQPPDRATSGMEQISIPLCSVDICSISESCFLTCFEFWVENVSRDIDNITYGWLSCYFVIFTNDSYTCFFGIWMVQILVRKCMCVSTNHNYCILL